MINNKKSSRNTCISSTSYSDSRNMHITKNNYTDTTAELEDLLTNKHNLRRKYIEGTDERMIDDGNMTLHTQIVFNMYKYMLLQILQNKDVSESQKIEHIREWEKQEMDNNYVPNIYKGILFSDW